MQKIENKPRFVYDVKSNTLSHLFDLDKEVSKIEFARFMANTLRAFGYKPSNRVDEFAPYALQKRAFFRWLLSKHDIPSFAMVECVTIDYSGFYSITFASVVSNLSTL